MSRREKIIIGLTLCAVGYVAFSFLFTPSSKTTPSHEVSENVIQEFVVEVAQGLAKHDITETELMILKKIQAPWDTQPFINGPMPLAPSVIRKGKVSQSTEDTSFRFTGYVEFGAKRLAIINDTEYEIGEQIEKTAFTVEKINSTQVELKNLENDTIIIPLMETLHDQDALMN